MSTWEIFLRIGDRASLDDDQRPTRSLSELSDKAQLAATATLRSLRENVLPLVRTLEDERVLDWFSFLVHERSSDDHGAYVHLRLGGKRLGECCLPGEPWCHAQQIEVDTNEPGWKMLGRQSELVLDVVEQSMLLEEPEALRELGQFLHYFANMTQLPVG